MVNIYCENITARHEFVFNVIFGYWIKTPYKIISSISDAQNASGVIINYSINAEIQGVLIHPTGFLSEKKISNFSPEISVFQDVDVLFPVSDPKAVLPYDIFSAIFWMISRYEEYLPFTADEHGRFELSQSLAGRKGFYQYPIVDFWITHLVGVIKKDYSNFSFAENSFNFQPTYDIDQAWAYQHKGIVRTLGAITKSIFLGKFLDISNRIRVLSGKSKDPFDSYDYIFSLKEKYDIEPIFFIHTGTKGKYDKNISAKNKHFKTLIERMFKNGRVGIHPSYRAANEPGLLEKEISLLSEATGTEINHCRQHFLRISLPETYRKYIACGITDDYSLGWATANGFRAGSSRSFPFYDLEKEEVTNLLLHPISMMDSALLKSTNPDIIQACKEMSIMILTLKSIGGNFMSVWHNHSLGTYNLRLGWKNVYEHIQNIVIQQSEN